jgi:hypothetical protein
VRFWDVASGTQVRQVAGSEFAFAKGVHETNRHVLTTKGDMLLITALPPSGGEQKDAAAPVACFQAPARIVSARCHGATICVGCYGGEVLFLQAPFLAA